MTADRANDLTGTKYQAPLPARAAMSAPTATESTATRRASVRCSPLPLLGANPLVARPSGVGPCGRGDGEMEEAAGAWSDPQARESGCG